MVRRPASAQALAVQLGAAWRLRVLLTATLFASGELLHPDTAAAEAPPSTTSTLRGTVRDAARVPAVAARVEILTPAGDSVANVETDAAGRFASPPLAQGRYRVRVTVNGLVSDVETVVRDAGATLDVTLEATVVRVAGSRGSPPGQAGSSVTAVSRRDLQSLPGGDSQSLTQVVLTQPGFAPDTFGPDGVLHVRGTEAGVLYVVDGVALPMGLAGQFADVLPTRIIQGMKLYTGGLPVEYGPFAGGVISITTRHAGHEPEGDAEVLYGTYQRVQPSVWYSQALGKTDVFVEGTLLSTQRGLDTPAASPILHDALLSGSAFTRLDFRPNDHERVGIIASFAQHRFEIPIDPTVLPLSDAPAGASRGPDRYGNAPPPFVPYGANPTELERDVFVAGTYAYEFARGSLLLTPYVRSSYADLSCDPTGSLGATADPGSVCANVARQILHEGQNAVYAWTIGEGQSWKAGLSIDDEQSSVDYAQFTRDDASPAGGADPALTVRGRDVTSILLGGAFLQDEITLGKLKLFPGVRVDAQNAVFGAANQPSLLLAGPSVRFGMAYSLSSRLVAHAFAGYLWQPPNAVDAAVAARVLVPGLAGRAIPNDVKAERDEYAELGITYRVPRKLTSSFTVYGRYAQDPIDVLTVGSTSLSEDYNYTRGRAVGAELAANATAGKLVRAFGNASWNVAQGQGIDSARYLFAPSAVAFGGWQILDHVQAWTANVGVDVHDETEKSHLSVLFQYGSGLRTGADNNQTVPDHATVNLTLRHRFDLPLRPEVAIDVLNLFDSVYAIRIANGLVGSAYAPLRQVDARLTIPFGG